MFKFRKKKKDGAENESVKFRFNEVILKTMSSEIVRCEEINVYFSCDAEQDLQKHITHDDIRQSMIRIGYIFSYSNIVSSKLSFEGAIRLELNKILDETGVKCDKVSIFNIAKI